MEFQRIRYVLLALACILCLSVTQISNIHASGPSSIVPFTIYGTTISVSFSYPDNFHFSNAQPPQLSDESVSLSVDVTFNNASISAINITQIHVELLQTNTNLTDLANQIYSGYAVNDYASSTWYSSYEIGSGYPSPIQIKAGILGETVSWDSNPMTFRWGNWGTYLNNQVQSRLFVELMFYLVDASGNVVWFVVVPSTVSSNGIITLGERYSLIGDYTGTGETPYVTVYPPSGSVQPQPLLNFETIIVLAILVIVGLIAGLIVLKKRREKPKIDGK